MELVVPRAPWDTEEGDPDSGARRGPRRTKEEEEGLVIPFVIGDCGFSPFSGKNGTAFQE